MKHFDLLTLGTKTLTKNFPGVHNYPIFSLDGQHIYFTSTNLSFCSIFKLNLNSGQLEVVYKYNEEGVLRHLKLNESGTRLYYNANLMSGDYVCSLDLKTQEIRKYEKGTIYPAGFTTQKNGTKLAYIIDGQVVIFDERDDSVLQTGIITRLYDISIQLMDDGKCLIISDNQEPYSDMYLHNYINREITYIGSGSWPCYHGKTGLLYCLYKGKLRVIQLARK